MLLDDLSDVFSWIRRIISRLDRLEAGAHLENSSITNGRMRFIGGLLRVDSGGRVEIVGTLQIDGVTSVTGELTLEGPWSMTGDGTITGNVTLTGDFNVTGGGKIVAGDVMIEPDKITVAGGSSPATLQDGKMSFGTGGTVEADVSVGGAKLTAGDAVVNVGSVASIRKGSASISVSGIGITIHPTSGDPLTLDGDVRIPLAFVPEISGTGLYVGTAVFGAGGRFYRSDGT